MSKGKEHIGYRLMEVIGYSIFYLTSFALLEQRRICYRILDTALDEMIPFCPVFILPYLLWFCFIALTVGWFVLFCEEDEEYYRFSRSLALGCTVFLGISVFFPNGQSLRPMVSQNAGIWEEMVRVLYMVDTPTNVFPSIHVYNALVCCEGLLRQETIQKRVCLRQFLVVLTVSIVLSTVFLKQHTLLDVVGAFLLWELTRKFWAGNPYHERVKKRTRLKA